MSRRGEDGASSAIWSWPGDRIGQVINELFTEAVESAEIPVGRADDDGWADIFVSDDFERGSGEGCGWRAGDSWGSRSILSGALHADGRRGDGNDAGACGVGAG